eukprot:gene3990-4541_t
MQAYDSAEVCELVGIFMLNKINQKYNKNDIGLYRDDGIAVFKNVSGRESERIKKNLQSIFKDNGLDLIMECKKTVEFEQDQGVEYVKIKFDGYDRTCFNQVFRKFASSIDSFIARCPNSIIGVHCTHGLNRTGYLVCRYMIDVLKYEPQNAIEKMKKRTNVKLKRLQLQGVLTLVIDEKQQSTGAGIVAMTNTSMMRHTERTDQQGIRNRGRHDLGIETLTHNTTEVIWNRGTAVALIKDRMILGMMIIMDIIIRLEVGIIIGEVDIEVLLWELTILS